MAFNNYVHLDRILEELESIHIPGTYWNLDEIKEWVYKALSKISDRDGNVYKKISLDIEDNKVKIPVDVEFLDAVLFDGIRLMEIDPNDNLTITRYFINFGYIYMHEDAIGKLDLLYYTTPLAEDGTPLIPDNKYYISAIVAFLRYKIGERAYWSKKILHQQFQILQQEWYFYIKATQSNNKRQFLKDTRKFRRIAKRF